MEIIRIRVQMNGEKTALSSLNAIDAKISEINKKNVSVKINTKEADSAKNAVTGMGNAAGTAAKQTRLLGDALSMIKFAAIGAAIGGVTVAFKNALTEMKAVDTELTNISKVSGKTGAELKSIGDAAYSTASKYGVAADQYLSAVYTFQKAGLGDSAEQMGELATKTMLVGDTSADVASKFIIATNAAWNMGGNIQQLSTVVDEADYINNNYATTLDKLAAAMPIVASTSANLGMSVEETMAVIGTITSITQETGTKAATAWRALAMNITKELGTITDETGETIEVTAESVKSISDALAIYGNDAVKAAQQTGQLIDPMEAVESLAQAYRDGLLTDIELQNILMSVGGKLRTNQLTALVKDLASDTSIYRQMLEGLGDAAGTADSEISVMLSSWDAKTKILGNTWTEFVQKSVKTDSIKGLLDGLTRMLNALDNLGNAAKLLGGILLTAFSGKITTAVGNLLIKLYDAVPTMESIKASALSMQGAFGAIGIAITALTLGYMKLKQNQEESIAAASEAAQTASQQAEAYAEQADGLEQLKSRYAELASDGISTDEEAEVRDIQNSINGLLDDQYGKIDLINGAYDQQRWLLDENLNILRQQSVAQAEMAKAQAGVALIKSTQNVFGQSKTQTQYAGGVDTSVFARGSRFEKSYDDWGLQSVSINWGSTADEIVEAYDDISDAIATMTQMYDDAELASNSSIGKMYNWLVNLQTGVQDTVTQYKALKSAYDQAIEAGDTASAEAYANQMETLSESMENAADTVESSVGRIARAKAELDAALSGTTSEDTAFNTIAEVYKDFQEEVESGRINSNAFWADANFLLGPERMAELGDNAEAVIQAIEDSQMGEVFDGANGNAIDFLETLLATADAEGNVADGAVTITDNGDSFGIMVNDVDALAEAWGMTTDEVYALLEALEAYGALDWSGDELVEHLQNLGIALNEAGQFDFTTLQAGLEAAGMSAAQIQETVDQLTAMGMIDMSGVTGEMDSVTTAEDSAKTGAEEAKSSIEDVDDASTSNAAAQFDFLTGTMQRSTGAAGETTGAVGTLNGQSLYGVSGQFGYLDGTIRSALNSAYSLKGALDSINGTTVNTYVNTITTETKMAEGTDNAPGGPALVGDEYSPSGSPKPELIVDHGATYLAGQNGPEIVNLRPGAKVFTYDETKGILSGRIPAFAVGGTFKKSLVSTSIGGGSSGSSSFSYGGSGYSSTYWSGSSGSSSSSSSAESAEDLEERLKALDEKWEEGWRILEFYIYEQEKKGASAEWMIKHYQTAMKKAEEEIQQFRDAGADENSEYIQKIKKQWWGYSDEIKKIEEESARATEEAAEKKKKAYEDAIKEITDGISEKLGDIDHAVYISEQNGTATAQKTEKAYKQAMKEIWSAIQALKKKGLASNADEIQKLEKQWYDYKNAIISMREEAAQAAIDTISENLEKTLDLIDHRVYISQQNGSATAKKTEQSYKDAMTAIWAAIKELRAKGVKANDEQIQALEKRWYEYKNAITALREEEAKKAQEAAEKAIQSITDKVNASLQDIDHNVYIMQENGTATAKKLTTAYTKAMNAISAAIKKLKAQGLKDNADEIQALQKQWWSYKDSITSIQKDLTDELKTAVKTQLDDAARVKDEKIQAIRDAAEEQEKADALAEKNQAVKDAKTGLSNAKKERTIRVWNAKTGQWEWVADASTVDSAQKALDSANKALAEEKAARAQEKQIAAIEAKYEKLEQQYDALLASMEDPARTVAAIAADINKVGTKKDKTAASGAKSLAKNISSAILSMEKSGGVSTVNGKSVLYGASGSTSGSKATATSGGGSGGTSYYINGVEISEAKAKTTTVAQLAKNLSALAIYNNT